jgi:biotin transporter BioY
MVTAAIICAAGGVVLLAIGAAWLANASGPAEGGDWRERASDTAADLRDWLRLGR